MKTKIRLFAFLALLGTLETVAQPLIGLQTRRHELGSILWKQPAEATFELENRGTTPLVITEVHPDCGCTAVRWTTDSIRPGTKGFVTVTYDAEMLGYFEKQVAVTTNADTEPLYLTISGEVVREKIDYSNRFPHHTGDIYYDCGEVDFDDVHSGDMQQATITLLNGSGRTYEPTLMHLPPYLTMEAVPARIRSGRTGKVILTLDSRKLHGMGLTQTSIYLSRYPGDRVSEENEIPVSTLLLPPAASLTPEQLAKAPVCTFDQTKLDMGNFDGKKRLKGEFILTNTGRSKLTVKSLQVYHPSLNVSLAKTELEPGESTRLRVTVVAKYLHRSKSRLRILLITNDPVNPKAILEVKTAK